MTLNFKSILSHIGKDLKIAWNFITSPAGQKAIAAAETVAEVATTAVNPEAGNVLTGAISLSNNIMAEVIKTEAIAAAAGQQSGSGAQKLAAVVAAITPQALDYAKAHGLPAPTSDQISLMVEASVGFLNAIPAPAPAA